MSKSNFERLIALADSTFEAHKDPQQLDVDETVIEQLQALHPYTVSEYTTTDGPALWVLIIPTTEDIMHDFLDEKIGEKELLARTKPGTRFDSIYLCSALTLPEYRNLGLTKKVALDAIAMIRKAHAIKSLFVWNFTREGENLSHAVAKESGLPLFERKHRQPDEQKT